MTEEVTQTETQVAEVAVYIPLTEEEIFSLLAGDFAVDEVPQTEEE